MMWTGDLANRISVRLRTTGPRVFRNRLHLQNAYVYLYRFYPVGLFGFQDSQASISSIIHKRMETRQSRFSKKILCPELNMFTLVFCT
jgi:hypothetical protein